MKHVIARRLQLLQSGQILVLLTEAYGHNNNGTSTNPHPNNKMGNSAAQVAADSDNYRTAITRACNFNKIATIDETNNKIVKKLYSEPTPGIRQVNNYNTNIQELHLPGDICSTILQSGRNKGTGLHCDSIDVFIDLVKLKEKLINDNAQNLFSLVYQGKIPVEARNFFNNAYLFCLHKDPNDLRKLRPISHRYPNSSPKNNRNTCRTTMER